MTAADSNALPAPGALNLEICRRLGRNWSALALYCDIP